MNATRPDFSSADLDAAVDAGLLEPRARDRLLAFAAARAAAGSGDPVPEAESFRLLSGFNDIFVTLACLLLLGALAALIPGTAAAAAVAAAAWGLAEYFTRVRRLALPSIVLLLAFVGAVFAFTFGAVTAGGHWGLAVTQLRTTGNGAALWAPLLVAGLAGAGAAALHWRRFRVPITLAAGAAALAAGLVGLTGALFGNGTAMLFAALAAGLATFAAAMRYDMADPARLTRNTDIAFWLHLLAAWLIVHPVFQLSGLLSGNPGPLGGATVLLVYLALTAVALAIDRRALLVSALGYVLYALQALFEGGQVAAGFALTALVLGSFLLILSAAWTALRRPLLARLPAPWAARLPPAS
jgi:hypothetical protein